MDRLIPASKFQELLLAALTKFYNGSPSTSKEALSVETNDERPTREHNPATRRLFEGLLYSWYFIVPDFLITIFMLVLLFTFLFWRSRLRSWKRQRRRRTTQSLQNDFHRRLEAPLDGQDTSWKNDGSSEALSSDSTLQGVSLSPETSSPNPAGGERSQLLIKPRNSNNTSWKQHWSYRIRAYLVYQPKPIPFFNKTLPSNHTTIAVLALIGIELFYTCYSIPFSTPTLFIFADRTSIMFAINLPLLYLLAAKNQPLKLLTGYSYESLNIFHRRLGEFMCLLAFLHSAGMFGVWYTLLRPTGTTLVEYLLSKIILLGLGTFVAYELLYLTSLGSFRQKRYEIFLAAHVFLQVAALVLLWFHHHRSRIPVGIALGIFIIDRLVYRTLLKPTTVTASLEVKDQCTVIICARIPRSQKQRKWRTLVCSDIKSGWNSTEHVFLTVPSLSQKHITQAHPFTIASKAPDFRDSESNLQLIVRARNGFTSDLLKFSQSHDETEIRIDGPYGSQSAVETLQNCDIPIIIAGGSGIAVTWPLIWSILSPDSPKDIESSALTGLLTRILFIWVVRETSHLTWLHPGSLDELRSQGVDVVIPEPTAHYGHPDIAEIIAPWIAKHDSENARKISIVCSGPDGLNRAVTNLCSSLLHQGRNVNVEIEKFGW